MDLNELEAQERAAQRKRPQPKKQPVSGLVAFMPWLRLQSPVSFGNVEFVPFRDPKGDVQHVFTDIESVFSMILSSYETKLDMALLDALVKADARASSLTLSRLVLPFVALANTDDELMDELTEAILMGSAFEQLFNANGEKRTLTERFGALFKPYGSVTVADALKVRPGIAIDQSKPERAAAQPTWWVHQKWIEELYDVRSKSAHRGGLAARKWGWTPFEHLVLAAFTFPLAVKLLLGEEGHYTVLVAISPTANRMPLVETGFAPEASIIRTRSAARLIAVSRSSPPPTRDPVRRSIESGVISPRVLETPIRSEFPYSTTTPPRVQDTFAISMPSWTLLTSKSTTSPSGSGVLHCMSTRFVFA